MHKKADLSLSINAIVILILAITMLGLGLAFMRNIFGKATGEFNEVGGEVQKQMIDQMKQTEKVVELSGAVYELKPGEKKMAYIGFKNDGNAVKDFMITGISSNSLTGLSDNCGLGSVGVNHTILEYKQTPTTVQPGATLVLPINIKTDANAQKDSCFYEITVDTDYKDTTGGCIVPECQYSSISPRGKSLKYTATDSCSWTNENSNYDICTMDPRYPYGTGWHFYDGGSYYCWSCESDGTNCDMIQQTINPPPPSPQPPVNTICKGGLCDCTTYLTFIQQSSSGPSLESIQLTVNIAQ
jgi:hypothetical protein